MTQKHDKPTQTQRAQAKNMHEDVPIWNDTPCCCEPEPRWQALADEQAERESENPTSDQSREPG